MNVDGHDIRACDSRWPSTQAQETATQTYTPSIQNELGLHRALYEIKKAIKRGAEKTSKFILNHYYIVPDSTDIHLSDRLAAWSVSP